MVYCCLVVFVDYYGGVGGGEVVGDGEVDVGGGIVDDCQFVVQIDLYGSFLLSDELFRNVVWGIDDSLDQLVFCVCFWFQRCRLRLIIVVELLSSISLLFSGLK